MHLMMESQNTDGQEHKADKSTILADAVQYPFLDNQ